MTPANHGGGEGEYSIIAPQKVMNLELHIIRARDNFLALSGAIIRVALAKERVNHLWHSNYLGTINSCSIRARAELI